VLADLPEQTATAVLQDMDRQEANELVGLMRFSENTAGGLMTPEFFASLERTTVAQAVDSLRGVELPLNSLDTVYLISEENVLTGAVPVVRLLLAAAEAPLVSLRSDQLVFSDAETQDTQVIELFDKYNLRSLPVVDAEQKLIGVVTVDDVVHRLWQKQA